MKPMLGVLLTLTSTEDGGRASAIHGDVEWSYRPNWSRGAADPDQQTAAPVLCLGTSRLDPGDSARAVLVPFYLPAWEDLRAGEQLFMYEGARLCGTADVVKVWSVEEPSDEESRAVAREWVSSGGDDRIHIRLMNDYSVELPLWAVDTNVEELDLSDELLSDLRAFASRWDAGNSSEVSDDRWDNMPVMRSLVNARHSLDRLAHPARKRAWETEFEEMRRLGEDLRDRLERELGPNYRVTYSHG